MDFKMFLLFIFLSSFFFVLILLTPGICQLMDSKIGNYSDVIRDYQMCGLSRIGFKAEPKCFEYNREINSDLKNARDMLNTEAPWSVYVDIRADWWILGTVPYASCGGVLIEKQWVLTSAHCLVASYFRIYFNAKNEDYVTSGKAIKHPGYDPGVGWRKMYDIGLIKLDYPIDKWNDDHTHHLVNTICLPIRNLTQKVYSLAIRSGSYPKFKIEPILIKHHSIGDMHYIHERPVFGSEYSCPGDSGSPIWKYHLGRAYLVGIHFGGQGDQPDKCSSEGGAVIIANYIDWILKIIQDN